MFRDIFSQDRVFTRAVDLVFATALTFGRKTMTQLRTTLGRVYDDWTADYRFLSKERFDTKAAASVTLRQTLEYVPVTAPYSAVIDATHVFRSSMKMPSTGWTRGHGTAK